MFHGLKSKSMSTVPLALPVCEEQCTELATAMVNESLCPCGASTHRALSVDVHGESQDGRENRAWFLRLDLIADARMETRVRMATDADSLSALMYPGFDCVGTV